MTPLVSAASLAGFDELIHPRTRLLLVATLAAADWAEFALLKDRLHLTDSALSKHLSTLERVGYLVTARPPTGRIRPVRVRLTETGRRAFGGHVAAVQAIVSIATGPGPDSASPSPIGQVDPNT